MFLQGSNYQNVACGACFDDDFKPHTGRIAMFLSVMHTTTALLATVTEPSFQEKLTTVTEQSFQETLATAQSKAFRRNWQQSHSKAFRRNWHCGHRWFCRIFQAQIQALQDSCSDVLSNSDTKLFSKQTRVL